MGAHDFNRRKKQPIINTKYLCIAPLGNVEEIERERWGVEKQKESKIERWN